jgi:hypothetical protein
VNLLSGMLGNEDLAITAARQQPTLAEFLGLLRALLDDGRADAIQGLGAAPLTGSVLAGLQEHPLASAARFIAYPNWLWRQMTTAIRPARSSDLDEDAIWVEALEVSDQTVIVPNEESGVPRLMLFAPDRRDDGSVLLETVVADPPYEELYHQPRPCTPRTTFDDRGQPIANCDNHSCSGTCKPEWSITSTGLWRYDCPCR